MGWGRGVSLYPVFRKYIPCPWHFSGREDPAHMLLEAGCEDLYGEGIFTLALHVSGQHCEVDVALSVLFPRD